jgi:hypothetical protein
MGLLADHALRELEEAACTAGLAETERRQLLFRHLPPRFRDSLPTKSRPSDQLKSDIYELNLIPELVAVEKPPLVIWLENAIELVPSTPEFRIFTQFKDVLDPNSSNSINFARGIGNFKDLRSRRELIQASIGLLTAPSRSYRASVVGPMFLHPSWYMERRNKKVTYPNYDTVLSQYIKQFAVERTNEIRFMFTKSERYRAKIEAYIEPTERLRFQTDLLEVIDATWGSDGERGPDVCCVHPGFLHIQILFDNAVIITNRPKPMIPTAGGILSYSHDVIERERGTFDNVFDSCSDGQQAEVDKLRTHIQNLW